MIEARGAKFAYVYHIMAIRQRGSICDIGKAMLFDTADSADEAYGRAMRIAHLAFPEANGWQNHGAEVRSLAGIDWVERHDIDQVTPVA